MKANNATITRGNCSECGSRTYLYHWPHEFAGIWECTNSDCGVSDSCLHNDRHIETTEDWPTSPLDNPHEYEIYVCDLCDCMIPLDEADPAIDRADAIDDSQTMDALGK
ncbi:hypothetical protein M1512_02310 [Patescibacteria group bacterium]|nr:hypothetical protein [Patescibacteria group bacterium]